MINENGFDLDSIDVFECDADYFMKANYFIDWMRHAAFSLRRRFDLNRWICTVIDSATWHNELIDETKPPKRSWRKAKIEDWLDQHHVNYDLNMKKSNLLQVAFENLPKKKFKVDVTANGFDVDILRLLVRHCSLNPIQLAW